MSKPISMDILFSIFTFLPVKSLLRFRCLSKSFFFLIDSPEFINSHLNLPSQTDQNRKLVLGDCHLEGYIYIIDIDNSPITSPVKIERRFKPSVKTPDNFIPVNPDGVFGSCNGVVAMYNKEGITLLNPSTNRFKSFPLWIVDILYNGFGYDSVSDDYKVVMVTKLFSEDFLRVMIYSVKNNSLRRIQDLHSPEPNSYRDYYEYSGVLVGSFLHWVARPRYDESSNDGSLYYNFILAFDLRDEKFHEVPLPLPLPRDTRDGDDKVLNMVSKIGGCLSMSYCFRGYVEIWIMKEYGIQDSWTKLLSLHSRQNLNFNSGLKPLCYSKEGDKVLLDYDKGKELILYDLKNQTFNRINIFKSSKYNKMKYGVFKSGVVCATTLEFPNVNGGSNNSCKNLPRRKKNSKKF
ncbi:F-box protein CPR1-like [Mercurialis annua]|uniref:F-box protein CPR1-like n=1 Tax=Mercurialis annua TaxID=3986 RepID=UPI00215E3108|nr:F-box protein CPR1-like [Mercurialis annua]